jgi:hypothetical protein
VTLRLQNHGCRSDILGAEPRTEVMLADFAQRMTIDAMDLFEPSEVIGPKQLNRR